MRQAVLQGNLQVVFDALYDLGVIEPVLQMDWKKSLSRIEAGCTELEEAIHVVNRCHQHHELLRTELSQLDKRALEFLAMEVAREYAGFHTHHEDLH